MNFGDRWDCHKAQLRGNYHDNPHLQNSWNKYGEENFIFEVIEVVDKCDIDEREKYWIDYYRKNGECYCIQDGGQPNNLVVYVSSESRKRTGELNRQRMLGSK